MQAPTTIQKDHRDLHTTTCLTNTARTLKALRPTGTEDLNVLLQDGPLPPNTHKALDQWFLWLLSSPDTPLSHWVNKPLSISTADMLKQWIDEGDLHPYVWLKPSHQIKQFIQRFSGAPPFRLHDLVKADLHFAGVLRSILLHTGTMATLNSPSHRWPASWIAYGEDQQIHEAASTDAGSDVATNTMLAVFTLNHEGPDPLSAADNAVASMARELAAITNKPQA